jgi:signal transduction histidine kinase
MARGGLLARMLLAVGLALVAASVVVMLVETAVTRQQLRDQAVALFGETGEVLEARLAADATRTNQLMSVVSQQAFLTGVDRSDRDEVARRTLSVVRTTDVQLDMVGVVDLPSGEVRTLGLPSRTSVLPPDPGEARSLASLATSSQRVVPLRDGGYGLVYVLSVDRLSDTPRLLVSGFALDHVAARRYLGQTGVDEVEVVVDGVVVAASERPRVGEPAAGDWTGVRAPQVLPDGRLVRYVALGADRPWDTPAAVGLISDDPLDRLAGLLNRTRAATLGLLLVLGGLLAYALTRPVTRPLRALTETATAIAGGDLDRDFQTDRRDEVGQLAEALEQMRRGLGAQLEVIGRQADALQDATRRMVQAQDQERQRIAQDLHDGIQQQLVVLRMQVGAARRELEQDPSRLAEVSDRFAVSIDHLLDQLRSTGQQLFPAILRDRGLGPAVFSLTARLPLPVDVALDPDPLPRVDPEIEINAYFLLSEAVLNAIKHAEAGRMHIEISVDDRQLRVHAHDDGRGFDVDDPGRRGGLTHMRDRVQALGGSLALRSSGAHGTRVDAVFPLDGPRSVVAALEVEQDRRDPSVEVGLLGESELAEDRVGVLLDGPFGDGQLPGDGRVPPA